MSQSVRVLDVLRCGKCDGAGYVRMFLRDVNDVTQQISTTCRACGGRGRARAQS